MNKLCQKCNVLKPIYEFRKYYRNTKEEHRLSTDGHLPYCKVCFGRKTTALSSISKPVGTPKVSKNSNTTQYRREYYRNRYETDLNFKLRQTLRARFRGALKRNAKKSSVTKHLGCTINEIKIYLESQFVANMSWDNYGLIWEIDHIKPLFTFDLTKPDELDKAWHFTNLRPLDKLENRRRSKK